MHIFSLPTEYIKHNKPSISNIKCIVLLCMILLHTLCISLYNIFSLLFLCILDCIILYDVIKVYRSRLNESQEVRYFRVHNTFRYRPSLFDYIIETFIPQ